ncbi:MAG: YwqG family protein [Hyphomicrobium sp.]
MTDIYKWLFGERGRQAIDDLADDPSGLLTPYIQKIRETELTIAAIDLGASAPALPTGSQLGGLPWWPAGRSYPSDTAGNPLYLLAQINFAELPAAPQLGMPRAGLLQFFIAADHLYGCNFENPLASPGFACVLHTDLAQKPRSDFSAVVSAPERGYLPLEAPLEARAMSFSLARMAVDPSDYRFERLLPEIAASDELIEAYSEYLAAPALRIGGYPTFTQQDPRSFAKGPKLGDVSLLTLDTTDGLMWGDSGVGQFLMHESDLRRADFSKVAYNWDCC